MMPTTTRHDTAMGRRQCRRRRACVGEINLNLTNEISAARRGPRPAGLALVQTLTRAGQIGRRTGQEYNCVLSTRPAVRPFFGH